METRVLKYLEFSDIKDELCRRLNIKDSEFVHGKIDLWHLWLMAFTEEKVLFGSLSYHNFPKDHFKEMTEDFDEEDFQYIFYEEVFNIFSKFENNEIYIKY